MQIYVGGRVEYRPPDVNEKPTVETLSAFLFPVTADFFRNPVPLFRYRCYMRAVSRSGSRACHMPKGGR
ncbi:hypothetical protein CES86_0829 [Brucella lupini]|uniref:Uncharacterized protein n=1 Tax=Brucella lupini TaxID=255457 RepID=A0A256GX35_9HYPH|nr:hypothetical protein CES86_0829 [Brucella lupini]